MSNELKITTKISCNRFGLVIRLFKCHPKNAQQSVNQLVKLTESSDKLKMISACVSRLVILAFGWLYPAYNSYKAVRTKNVKEYVRWMMHWIVFAIFSSIELFTDTFISWFPFYYEVKVSIVFWLLSPVTKGSSIIYKKFIHPKLSRHEQEIDEYLNQAKEKGYTAVLQLGTKGFDYASKLIVETAIKATSSVVGGGTPRIMTEFYQKSMVKSKSCDVVDYPTDNFDDDSSFDSARNSDLQPITIETIEVMEVQNVEFSDYEEPEEDIPRQRTRSQSRAKENSLPPTEPVKIPKTRAKKTTTKQPSRRRALKIDAIEDGDESYIPY